MTELAALLIATDNGIAAGKFLAQPAPDGPPWLVLVLAMITAVTAIVGPLLLKRLDRGQPGGGSPVTPPAVEGSVDLVSDAMLDARRERDEAQDHAQRLAQDLADTRVLLARAEALLDAHRIQRPGHPRPRPEGGDDGA